MPYRRISFSDIAGAILCATVYDVSIRAVKRIYGGKLSEIWTTFFSTVLLLPLCSHTPCDAGQRPCAASF